MLQAHIQDMHNNVSSRFKCEKCDEEFVTVTQLQAHIQYTHNNVSHRFKCEKLDEEFVTVTQLKKHNDTYHEVEKQRQYNCEDCDFQADNRLHL